MCGGVYHSFSSVHPQNAVSSGGPIQKTRGWAYLVGVFLANWMKSTGTITAATGQELVDHVDKLTRESMRERNKSVEGELRNLRAEFDAFKQQMEAFQVSHSLLLLIHTTSNCMFLDQCRDEAVAEPLTGLGCADNGYASFDLANVYY